MYVHQAAPSPATSAVANKKKPLRPAAFKPPKEKMRFALSIKRLMAPVIGAHGHLSTLSAQNSRYRTVGEERMLKKKSSVPRYCRLQRQRGITCTARARCVHCVTCWCKLWGKGHSLGPLKIVHHGGLWMAVVISWWALDGCCYFLVGSGWLLLLLGGLWMAVVTCVGGGDARRKP